MKRFLLAPLLPLLLGAAPDTIMSSDLELASGIGCFNALDQTTSDTIGYPPGYAAIAGKHGKRAGAYLFGGKKVFFFESLEADANGGFMEFWGASPSEFLLPLTSREIPIDSSVQASLAQALLEKMSAHFDAVKGTKVAAPDQDKNAPLSDEEVRAISAVVTRNTPVLTGRPATGEQRSDINPLDPDAANQARARANEQLLDAVDKSFAAFNELPVISPASKTTAGPLHKALDRCIGVKGERRVSDLARKLKASLEDRFPELRSGTPSEAERPTKGARSQGGR